MRIRNGNHKASNRKSRLTIEAPDVEYCIFAKSSLNRNMTYGKNDAFTQSMTP